MLISISAAWKSSAKSLQDVTFYTFFNLAVGATAYAVFEVTVQDENDNAPKPHGGGWEATICSRYEEGKQHLLTVISALDVDSAENGAPFTFELQPNSNFLIESKSDSSSLDG